MKLLKYWGPVAVWMVMIFLLSNRATVHVSDEKLLNFLFYKTLHLLEYSFLYVLSFRAFKNSWPREPKRLIVLGAFLLILAYALTDEIHQLFIPTREGRLRDVIIDSLGALLAWTLIAKLLPKAPKKLRTWARSWGIT